MKVLTRYLLLAAFFSVCYLNAQDKPELEIGGALRLTYNLSSWKEAQKKRGGDFGYDMFRLNVKGSYKGVKINTEYRLYSDAFGGGMLKQGWFGYDFNENDNLQVGLTQVPFGITQYNSHNWFFSLNFYLGLEDDHDMGAKFTHTGDKIDYVIAFFKNAEDLSFGNLADASNSRYAYDIASIDIDGDGILDIRNKEVNQLNGKINYKLGTAEKQHKLGASAQFGMLQNLDNSEMGNHYALSAHYELTTKKYDVKAAITNYGINPKNPEGEPRDMTALTAFGAPYLVASKGTTYTLGAAYNFPVEWGPISNIQVYNDFGYLQKTQDLFEDTISNTTGALITAGKIYTYVDFAAGKNMPWLNPDYNNALAQGSALTDTWELRFNVNIGYYF